MPYVPLLLGLGLAYLVMKPRAKAPVPHDDGPGPLPPKNVDTLRAELVELLKVPPSDPNLKPEAFDALAVELDAAGLPVEAAAARTRAGIIRLTRQGGGIAHAGTQAPTPTTLPPILVQQIQALLADPNALPAALQQLSLLLEKNFPGDVSLKERQALAKRIPELLELQAAKK